MNTGQTRGMTHEKHAAYGRLAALVYNVDKPVGLSFGDLEFYRDRLTARRAREVLEPAAGNGRVLIPLARAGFGMTGFDNSPEMLDHLRRNCAEQDVAADVVDAAFDTFAFEKRFDAVILPAGSFQLIDDAGAAAAFLRRCRSHLRGGGQMIFDLDAEHEFLDPTSSARIWQLWDGSAITLTETVSHFDADSQQVEYAHRYEHLQDGRTISSQSEIFRLRWWRLDQIVPLLIASGFGDIVVSGGYQWRREPRPDQGFTLEARAV
jgi:SAM-dependent methyltransferase